MTTIDAFPAPTRRCSKAHLGSVWIPYALASGARLRLEVFLTKVLVRRLALHFLELRPSVLEELRREIRAAEFGSTNVARDVVAGREGVRGCERDRLAYDQRAQKLA